MLRAIRRSRKSKLPPRLRLEQHEQRVMLHGVGLTVDNPVDESDGDFSLGDLSLREAVEIANANANVVDLITFNMTFLSGSDIDLTLIESNQSALVVTDSVVIQGPGSDILTVDGSSIDPTPGVPQGDGLRLFELRPGTDVSISGLTLTGADVNGSGGAIQSQGRLTLNDVVLRENSASSGGGLSVSQFGSAEIADSAFIGNRVSFRGGGIDNFRADVSVVNTTFVGNGGGLAGGAIWNSGGTLDVQESLITGNGAGFGGGIGSEGSVQYDYYYNPYTYTGYFYYFIYEGNLSVSRSTISSNIATGNGGGISGDIGNNTIIEASTIANNSAGNNGGGISLYRGNTYPFYSGGTALIYNSTITGNSAADDGGGVHDSGTFSFYYLDIAHSTITNNISDADADADGNGGGITANSDATIGVFNSIVSGNRNAPDGGVTNDVAGVSSFKYSLVGDASGTTLSEAPVGSPDAFGNLIGGSANGVIDAELAPLGDNGGSTVTHALFATSPAIDAGGALNTTPLDDQRGFQRIIGPTLDMGAFEVQSSPAIDGDFDDSGVYDCSDIDALVANIALGPADVSTYDLNGDGLVNNNDLTHWLAEAGSVNLPSGNPYLRGDANLDGFVDGADFIIWNQHKFTNSAAWCHGDFNADGVVDGGDFIIWNGFKFQSAALSGDPTRLDGLAGEPTAADRLKWEANRVPGDAPRPVAAVLSRDIASKRATRVPDRRVSDELNFPATAMDHLFSMLDAPLTHKGQLV